MKPSPNSIPLALEDLTGPGFIELLAYWEAMRGDRFAPSWSDFDLLALDSRSIPQIVIADVRDDPRDFVYRFWGTGHVTAKNVDKTGKPILSPPLIRGSTAVTEYMRVVEEKRPLAFGAVVDLPELGQTPFYQTILRVPLSDDGHRVNIVLSLADWTRTGGVNP